MRISLVLCAIVLLRAVDRADCNLGDFLNNLPSEIGNGLSKAWNTFVKAIRKPVRLRRLGKKTSSTAITSTITLSTVQSTATTIKLLLPSFNRLMLPVLTTPKWKSLQEWKELQKPSFVGLKPVSGFAIPTPSVVETNEIGGDQRESKLNDENDLGPLIFI